MATPPQPSAAETEADFADADRYVRAIRRRWLVIGLGAIVCGALAFVYASSRPLAYEGVTTLLVVPPTQGGGAQINPATFRAVVENATLASQVIEELSLRDQITPQDFVERALSVEEVRGTNIVKVKVRLADPKIAADASRRLAQKAITLTQQVNQLGGASVQEQLKNHLNDARARMEKAELDLLSYKQHAQVDLIQGDANAQLVERAGLLGLVINIEAERARLAAAEQEIKRQQPLLSAPRAPGAEDALRRANGNATAGQAGAVEAQQLDLTNPFVNPVYQTLDFQIAMSRTRIAALEKQRDEIMHVKKLGGAELKQLSELYRREIEQARLQETFDLALKVHGDLAVRYEQSRTQPLGTTAQLQVVDNALPPEHPVSRKRVQYGIFGAGVGVVGMMMLTVFWESRGRRSRLTAS
jgi:uncharacterized protein involved in exopolysaccharide biosynthesis